MYKEKAYSIKLLSLNDRLFLNMWYDFAKFKLY